MYGSIFISGFLFGFARLRWYRTHLSMPTVILSYIELFCMVDIDDHPLHHFGLLFSSLSFPILSIFTFYILPLSFVVSYFLFFPPSYSLRWLRNYSGTRKQWKLLSTPMQYTTIDIGMPLYRLRIAALLYTTQIRYVSIRYTQIWVYTMLIQRGEVLCCAYIWLPLPARDFTLNAEQNLTLYG